MIIPPRNRKKFWLGSNDLASTTTKGKASRGRPKKPAPSKAKPAPKAQSSSTGKRPSGRATRPEKTVVHDREPEDEKDKDPEDDDRSDLPPNQETTFPVVITTYEILMKDRVELSNYKWGFVVVDEGHRLKNMDCRLIRELKLLPATGRMVLTGTPLHVSISCVILTCAKRLTNRIP